MGLLASLPALRRTLRRISDDPVDAQVAEALRRLLHPGSQCVDVGAHRGAVLDRIIELAPYGSHVAVEPLPRFAARLRRRYPRVDVREVALADASGVSEFHHVVRKPAYSGLRRRRYEREDEAVEMMTVSVRRLDDVLDADRQVDVVKIDVEGGELGVLLGARRTLSAYRPALVFEHGFGAAEFYDSGPTEIHDLLAGAFGYQVFTLGGWLAGGTPLDLAAMEEEFRSGRSYMFVAVAA